jgi:AcrR family transcriptional regulator
MTTSEKKLRADAQANRSHILSVARDALTTDPSLSLNAVAKMAGVGPGTLYRHFPTREALVVAVYWQEIDALVRLVPTLLAEYTALEAFEMWCDRLVDFGKMKHGIYDLLHTASSDRDLQDTYSLMLDAVRTLMSACESSGEIHPGNDAEDFLMLVGLLWRILPTADGEARVKRLLALAFRGLGATKQ